MAEGIIERSIDTRPAEGRGIPIVTTLPEALVRHDIGDEELSMLMGSATDRLWEAMWTLIGTGLGSAPSALAALLRAYTGAAGERVPLSPLDLGLVLMFFMSWGISVALFAACRKRTMSAEVVAGAIRERTRRQISG